MDATSIFISGILITGALAVLGIFAVAFRRGPSAGPVTLEELDTKQADAASQTKKAERRQQAVDAADDAVAAVATIVEAPPEATADPLTDHIEVTVAEYNVTRRRFFNRALIAVFGLFLLQFGLAGIAFIWPKIRGGFGTPVNAGNLQELKEQISVAGATIPLFVPAAQAWIVTFGLDELEGSSYENSAFVVAGGESDGVGVMALWQKCVHLGCRVPSCVPSQGFECPCHGSKYNIHGEYEAGPAPRNLDRFEVEVNDSGDLIIQTGVIVETARSKNKTAAYPQGPFCV
ncbi:MAG: hypothetical protein BMS9Abin07_0334 [Acidimicrobiia bacterium]|nr:MAG: hypothetical protein BMS9Abin07_0334 [Acidimicrobiia bacterium]